MKDLPEETKRIASVPFFELGNHSYSHPHMTDLSEEQVRGEIEKTQDILFSLTGRHARFFRPPYGEYDSLLVHRSKQLGLTTVDYSLPSGDPDTTITKDRMVQYVASMARGGSIVIMHVNRRGWHTAEALPEIINYLKTRGFEFVTVSELVGEDQKSKGKDQN
jgi:peptidoglycan/xylan/chitin deacetylase (PgdA/CDA1 family)